MQVLVFCAERVILRRFILKMNFGWICWDIPWEKIK